MGVVKELLEKYPAMTTAKNQCDKLSYEIMDDAAQTFLKAKIQDNITKYFMLIVFSAYIGKVGEDVAKDTPEEEIKLTKTFAAYMEENQELATMINKGKGKLKWERDMPRDIEEIIHKVFRDMSDVG